MSESEDQLDKPLDPFDPEVIARSNRAILVGLQRQDDTAAEAQALLDELHELVSNVCVESVNAAMDHVMSRKLLEAGRHPAPAQACDPAVALKSLL